MWGIYRPLPCRPGGGDGNIGCRSVTLYNDITMPTKPTNPSPLYVKLLAETAKIDWHELERLFAQGKLLLVAPDSDLVSVAEAIANDDKTRIADWLTTGVVQQMPVAVAADFATRKPPLWAVVVSPWVCVQECP